MKLKGISQNLRLFVKMCNKDINSTNLNEIFLPFCTPTKIWNSFSGLPDGATPHTVPPTGIILVKLLATSGVTGNEDGN